MWLRYVSHLSKFFLYYTRIAPIVSYVHTWLTHGALRNVTTDRSIARRRVTQPDTRTYVHMQGRLS